MVKFNVGRFINPLFEHSVLLKAVILHNCETRGGVSLSFSFYLILLLIVAYVRRGTLLGNF